MLLALDVGNTNTVLGLFDGTQLRHHWRIETKKERTDDELGVLFKDLLAHENLKPASVDSLIISNVVPPMQAGLERMAEKYLKVKPVNVGLHLKLPITVALDNPEEIGADRIVNASAAYTKYASAVIVVDFGTATTFDYITPKGEYAGGAIAPGIGIANEALIENASRLPHVEVRNPGRVIGKNTVACMQSGVFYGYVGLVDSLVERIRTEARTKPKVIATGGLADLVAKESRTIETVEPFLTLEGLRILFEANR